MQSEHLSLRGKTICLVTSGHVGSNPRLVKEADALVTAGAHVQVIAVDNYHARIRITAPKSVEIMRNELDEHAEVSMEITSCG